ncbi:phosphatase and actin regulator 2 [Trichonephila clavipes]|nr:phosphatase and actin regulator 2 [Trichonephila clavipes]
MYKNALKEDLIRVVEDLDGTVESTNTIAKHRRFAMLRRFFKLWQWKRRKKRDSFEQTSRTLERKISMRSTKEEFIKKDVLMPDGSDKNQDSKINVFSCGTFLMSKRCLHMMEKLSSSEKL